MDESNKREEAIKDILSGQIKNLISDMEDLDTIGFEEIKTMWEDIVDGLHNGPYKLSWNPETRDCQTSVFEVIEHLQSDEGLTEYGAYTQVLDYLTELNEFENDD